MTPKSLRPAPWLLLAGALTLSAPAAALAAPTLLPDSTFVEQWTLANGLRVSLRHVPGASHVSVSVAYGSGSAADPAGREGLAWLLAEAHFTAATAESPERSRRDIDSQRPLGWHVKVLPRATVFSETCTPAQYPVVLHQAAARMRGVTLTPQGLRQALAAARGDLRGLYGDNPDSVAYALPWAVAAGADAAALARLAGGTGLDLPAREVEQALRERFVPANAALALAGDLSGVDLHAFLEREFGAIPGGTAPAAPAIRLAPVGRTVTLAGLSRPVGVVGVIGPAIADIDHAEFYLASLFMGSRGRGIWGPPLPPITSPFKFALLDDPDLVRFYPPTDPERTDTTWVGDRMEEVFDPMARAVMPPEAIDSIKRNVFWLLGGPMLPTLARRARGDAAVLHTLSTSMATRALWGSEEFWAGYRDRFARLDDVPMEKWVGYALRRTNQVRVVLMPPRR